MSIDIVIKALKQRLEATGKLTLQREDGELREVTCEWNDPASEKELADFSLKTGWYLPEGYRQFLKLHNGAKIFTDSIDYFELFDLNNIIKYYREYEINYKGAYKKSWYMIGYYKGFGDYLFIDAEKAANNNSSYLVYVQTGDIQDLPLNFDIWFDRFIVAQGARYWLW
ncbi:SMI1/KNR4 family protein [Calidifontibacillus erzurumensis]|uniref:SMI1/KNR4 family protein n=1 Tax=Calidifontibacillus erzurumensis TaxID=2741433 RepID=UPI0035B5144B